MERELQQAGLSQLQCCSAAHCQGSALTADGNKPSHFPGVINVFFVQMLVSRDILWLSPAITAEMLHIPACCSSCSAGQPNCFTSCLHPEGLCCFFFPTPRCVFLALWDSPLTYSSGWGAGVSIGLAEAKTSAEVSLV